MARKTDYETARGYLNKKTTEYAREILPEGISVRVLISGDIDKHVPRTRIGQQSQLLFRKLPTGRRRF